MNVRSKLIYPNPFTPVGIEFEIDEDAVVTIGILDDQGSEVQRIINDTKYEAGCHLCPIHSTGEPARWNYYRLTIRIGKNEIVETRSVKSN